MKLCSTPIKFAIPKRAIVDTPGHSQADYITIVRHAPKWKLMNEERNGKKDCVVEHRKASRGCKRCSTTPKTIIWAALYENAVKIQQTRRSAGHLTAASMLRVLLGCPFAAPGVVLTV